MHVMVVAKASPHRGCGVLPAIVWGLVDQCVLTMLHRGRALADVEPTSSRHRALGLLFRRLV
jgi:hypothetical protein